MIFVLAYLLSQGIMRVLFPDQYEGVPQGEVILTMEDATLRGGHHPVLRIRNASDTSLVFADRCPTPPVDVFKREGDTLTSLTADTTALPCEKWPNLASGQERQISLAPWKYSLFGAYGEYRIRLPGTDIQVDMEIYEPGVIVKMFRVFITKPFLNALVWFASLAPGHSLGLGVILLTLLVKLGLYFPTQHALEGQKRMQLLQPKIEAIKKRYAEDREKLHQETLKLWKEEGINPFSSFIPMLLQFPILIGLFFVIRDGGTLELSQHLLYTPYQDLPWTFGTMFLWMDLTKPNITVFPLLLAALQFVQMKLSFRSARTAISSKPAEGQELQQKVMLYALPLMIGFFAFQFPAAVSLYWGVSTLFAIGQQVIVNKRSHV